MAGIDLRQRLKGTEPFYFSWASMPGVHYAEALARLPFEGVCIDMQHGLMGFTDMAAMAPVIARAGKVPIVRVIWNQDGLIGQALDSGAQVVIAPMINTLAQAKAFVHGAKYVPQGGRSWSGYAASLYQDMSRDDYLKRGNELSVLFAMIETQEAIDNLDAIAALEGIDGLFVGPADLTISLTGGKSVDTGSEITRKAMQKIAECALKHGKAAGSFGAGAAFSKQAAAMGYRFISAISDASIMALGAEAFLAGTR